MTTIAEIRRELRWALRLLDEAEIKRRLRRIEIARILEIAEGPLEKKRNPFITTPWTWS